jgi:hypothetical protein
MRRIAFVFLGLVLVLASGGATLASPVIVELTNANGIVSNDGSVYVGPYQLLIGGQTTINAPCDDYYDEIWVGESWQANVNPLNPTGVSNSLFGNPSNPNFNSNADSLYLEAAYLTSLFGKYPTSDYNDISYAIWGLFDPAALSSSNYDSGAQAFLSLAEDANLNFGGFNGWQILTPKGGTQPQGDGLPQEFIVPAGNHITPEPATLVMLGSGLLAVGLALRNKRASSPSV